MITSASNKSIKNVQALLSKAKERKKQGVFVVEGPKMSFEAPYDWVSAVYMSESFFNDDRFKEEKKRFLDKTEIVSDPVFKSMSDTQTPQGVLAIVKMPHYEIDELFKGDKTELLVLESIQDPGNLGTMIRTGEGAGVSGTQHFAEVEELMCTETVVFNCASPVIVYHFGSVLFRTDTVHPVIFIGKTATRPTKYGNLKFFQCIEYIGTITFDIGDIRIFSYPKSTIDASTEMFGKLAVDFFGNNLCALVGMKRDRCTLLCGQRYGCS